MNEDDRLLTAEDLARFLDVPIKTLYAWRYRGEGPVGFRVGKHIRYRWADVDRWIRERIRVTETSRGQSNISASGALASEHSRRRPALRSIDDPR